MKENKQKFIKIDPSKVVVINAMAEIKFCGDIEDAYEYIFKTRPIERSNATQALLFYSIIKDNYIVFHLGDIWRMFDKLKLIYIKLSSDKTKILGGYFSMKQAADDSDVGYLSKVAVRRSVTQHKICSKDNCYYVGGEEAVNYLKELGYLDETLKFNDLSKDEKEDYTHFPSIYVQKQKLKYQNLQDNIFVPITIDDIPELPIEANGLFGINKLGQVISYKTNNILSNYKTKSGYNIISLFYKNNKNKMINKKYPVHRLLSLVFLNNVNPKRINVVNHINQIRDDNRLENLEWVTVEENLNPQKVSPRSEKYLGKYIGRDKVTKEIVESFTVRNIPKQYDYKKLRNAIKADGRSNEYKGLIWEYIKPKQNIKGFSDNLDDYTWLKHWKYNNVWVCEEGFIKVNNKISYYLDDINSGGYVFCSIKQKSYPVHRVIMEYLAKRDLDSSEFVDHINRDTSDNSFKNLRITNAKGNSLNENTLKLVSNDVVVVDLYGKFVKRGFTREIYEFIFGEGTLDGHTRSVLNTSIINHEYICFKFGDLNTLFEKLKSVVLLVSKDKRKILGSFTSIKKANNSGLVARLSDRKSQECGRNGTLGKNGVYYLTGQSAVDTLKDLGYLNEIIRMNTITNQEKNL